MLFNLYSLGNAFMKGVIAFGLMVSFLLCPLISQGYEDHYSTGGHWEYYGTYNAGVAVNRNEQFIARASGPYFRDFPNNWSYWVITPEIRNTPDGVSFTLDFTFDNGEKRYTYNAGTIHPTNGVINLSNNPTEKLEELATLLQNHQSMTVYVNTAREDYREIDSSSGRQVIHAGTVTSEQPYTFSLKGASKAMQEAKAWAMAAPKPEE